MEDRSAQAPATDDELEYRALEPWSIVALGLGLLSPLVLIDPLLSLLPSFGLLAALASLARMKGDPLRPGRRAALVGLGLCGVFLMVPLAHYTSANWLLARQARPVADEFVELLRQRAPQQAMLLMMYPDARPPAGEGLWSFYRHDDLTREQLRKLVENPAVRMLYTLGDKADIQFYKTNGTSAGKSLALVDYWYTVTFKDESGRKKTLMLGVLMERKQPANKNLNPWRVKDFTTEIDLKRLGA